MNQTFYIDPSVNRIINYSDFIFDLNNSTKFYPICYSSNYYDIFKSIILSILIDTEITILDSDFSKEEISRLLGEGFEPDVFYTVDQHSVSDFSDLINQLQKSRNWKLSIFTSGTTGQPKCVTHNLKTLTRFLKINKRNRGNVWGYSFNPTHIAGIQVFFQAFFNFNAIVRLFNLDRDIILGSIEKWQITHISATPTFYRLLFPAERQFSSVRRVTFGGEKLDEQVEKDIRFLFPNAKLLNVYASTEAGSIFASNNNIFQIKDKYQQLVRIDFSELLIHKDLLGDSSEIRLNGDWYHTGDLVQIVHDKPLKFKFLTRKNELINVGGYKVNPNEVEEAILKHQLVKDVRVFGKKNSILGNIICCEIVKLDPNLSEQDILIYLRNQLQEFKIPRIIYFKHEIQSTRTGKKKRNSE